MSTDPKFKIDRIEKMLEIFLSDWEGLSRNINNKFENLQKLNDRERNPIIAVLAGFIPILLAITSFEWISISELILYAVIDFFVIIAYFFIHAILNYKNAVRRQKINNSISITLNSLKSLRQNFSTVTFDLKNIDDEQLIRFYSLSRLVEGESVLRLRDTLLELLKDKLLHTHFKIEFTNHVMGLEQELKDYVKLYEKTKSFFEEENWKHHKESFSNLQKFASQKTK